MTRRAAWLLLLPLVAACRCQPGPVEPIELGLRVQPPEVDFGRVLEGTTRKAQLTLTAETRASIPVSLSTSAPFGSPASAEVPGGGDTTVEVSFLAGSTPVEGVLRLTVGEKTAEVKLRGVGVRPPDCRPSAECITSVYSLEEDRCIESPSPDDAPCDTASVCLEQGRCRAGQCLGIARRCDDNDACTDDACAMDLGCIHTPHACPTPAGVCRAATCDPRVGCGEGPAPDLTVCGPSNCVEVNFCLQGACKTQPTPEGLPCSPPVACLPEAQCRNQMCTRVTEAEWIPDWSARLDGEPTGGLASSGSTLFFSACVDAGPGDAGPGDGDGGAADAGSADAGVPDGGEVDGGAADAGRPLVCGLLSYTGTGFERFARPYDDDAPRAVLAVSAAGVLLTRDGGLELRSPMSGLLRQGWDVEAARPLLVLDRERVFLWVDGGVQQWLDGGVSVVASIPAVAALGRGAGLFAWAPDAGVLTRVALLDDGGVELQQFAVGPLGVEHLAVSGDYAVFGSAGRARLASDGDGGFVAFDWADAGASQFRDELTLTTGLSTNIFFLRCDGGCADAGEEVRVRVFDPALGLTRWDTVVSSRSFPGEMLATSLVDGLPGAFVTLLREETDAGPRAKLAFFAEGDRQAVCRLPPGSGGVERAHFSSAAMVVMVRRPDGRVVLESFDLAGLPVSRTGWATPQGAGGTRSDRP